MKLNTIALALGMGLTVMAGSVMAKPGDDTSPAKITTDNTHVYFDGTITNAPCSMPNSSRDQHVKMGSIAAHVLKDSGTSAAQPFHFDLIDCPVGTSVDVTFSGATDPKDATLLSLGSGEASGAGIQILAEGKPVALNKAGSKQTLGEGDNTLTFAAQLKGDGASVTPGDFSAVSNVTFTYQ
ncbi:fimbrial protein (plasmid) [Pantoea agglomerans]|uniref:fimbrial protein n=1 Tax=Enterobacter agglomerans TaxID=549 RepID=UPI00178751D2|nr:fimbrial protein [Pantoea agglomerans]WVL92370.1 fimbrial protein [Pantoea agglomerans]